jgi:hypothetical protein
MIGTSSCTTFCHALTSERNARSIKAYDVVCMTASRVSEQRRIGSLCRKHSKKFLTADAHGFFAITWLDLLEHR